MDQLYTIPGVPTHEKENSAVGHSGNLDLERHIGGMGLVIIGTDLGSASEATWNTAGGRSTTICPLINTERPRAPRLHCGETPQQGRERGETSCEDKDSDLRLNVRATTAGGDPHGTLQAGGPLWLTQEWSPQERLHRPLRLQHCSPLWEELHEIPLNRHPAEEKPCLELSSGSSPSTSNPTAYHGDGTRITWGDWHALTAYPALQPKVLGTAGSIRTPLHVCNE